MNSEQLICTKHEEIIAICRTWLEELPPEPGTPEEFSGIHQAFRDIKELAEEAMEMGQRMEDRLIDYKAAIKSLGYERVKK